MNKQTYLWSSDPIIATPLTYKVSFDLPTNFQISSGGTLFSINNLIEALIYYSSLDSVGLELVIANKYKLSFPNIVSFLPDSSIELTILMQDTIKIYINGIEYQGTPVNNTLLSIQEIIDYYKALSTEDSKIFVCGDTNIGFFNMPQKTAYRANQCTEKGIHTLILYSQTANTDSLVCSEESLIVSYNFSEIKDMKISDASKNRLHLYKYYGVGCPFYPTFEHLLSVKNQIADLPLTYDIVAEIPKTGTDKYTGIIFAMNDAKLTPNSSFLVCDTIVDQTGTLRLYGGITDATGKTEEFSLMFNNCLTPYIGKQVRISLILDPIEQCFILYLDGKQVVTDISVGGACNTKIDFANYYKRLDVKQMALFTLGGDHREAKLTYPDNYRYYRGQLYEIKAFKPPLKFYELPSIETLNQISDNDLYVVDSSLQARLGSNDYILNYNIKEDMYTKVIKDRSIHKNDISNSPEWLDSEENSTDFEYDYSFVVVGDTQTITRDETCINQGTSANPTYSKDYEGNFSKIYDWILANKETKNIKFVLHTGDITDWSQPEEWQLATTNFNKLKGILPHIVVRGNHDVSDQFIEYIKTTDFIANVTANESYGFFDGRNIEGYSANTLNYYQTLSIANNKYLILALDFGPCKAVIDWANEIVASFPEHNVIILTHSYIHEGIPPEYMNAPIDCSPSQYNPGNTYGGNPYPWDFRLASHKAAGEDYEYKDASYMLENLVKVHSNICMVICGHDSSNYIRSLPITGNQGNLVQQILVDPQEVDRALQQKNLDHAGLVAIFYVNSTTKTIRTEYYSTIRKQYYKVETNHISLPINLI